MSVRPTPEKAKTQTSLQAVSEVIFPRVDYARLYYISLKIDKIKALKESKGDIQHYINYITISTTSLADLRQWVNNIKRSFKPVSHGDTTLSLYSGASKEGWGVVCNVL